MKRKKPRIKKIDLVWSEISQRFCNSTIGRQCFLSEGGRAYLSTLKNTFLQFYIFNDIRHIVNLLQDKTVAKASAVVEDILAILPLWKRSAIARYYEIMQRRSLEEWASLFSLNGAVRLTVKHVSWKKNATFVIEPNLISFKDNRKCRLSTVSKNLSFGIDLKCSCDKTSGKSREQC